MTIGKYPYIMQIQKEGKPITVPCRIIAELADSYVIEYHSGNTYTIGKKEFEELNNNIKEKKVEQWNFKDEFQLLLTLCPNCTKISFTYY